MPRVLSITSYTLCYATCWQGFNEWRSNIFIRTSDAATSADLRFVDNPPALPENVNENGVSLVYLRAAELSAVLNVLQSEKPLWLALYGASKRAIVQTGPEPPGEEEGV